MISHDSNPVCCTTESRQPSVSCALFRLRMMMETFGRAPMRSRPTCALAAWRLKVQHAALSMASTECHDAPDRTHRRGDTPACRIDDVGTEIFRLRATLFGNVQSARHVFQLAR